ncbi:serine/threonine protein kinase, partial [Frankia sp. AiPs1]|nr:serine/threonine protein kinase [Frankia sp. AiPs1]
MLSGPATEPLDLVLAAAAGYDDDPGPDGRRRARLITAVAAAGAVIVAALMVIGLLVHAHGGPAHATASAVGEVPLPGGQGGLSGATAGDHNTAPTT